MPVESSYATACPATVSLATFFFSCIYFGPTNIRFLCDCIYYVESVILFSILGSV